MFQRTRIRLTILNSLVFIILIGVLATVIYSFAGSRLYRDVNSDLLEAAERLTEEPGQRRPLQSDGLLRAPRDPRIVLLIWNEKSELITLNESGTIFADNESEFRPKELEMLRDTEAEGFHFRTIAIKAQHPNLGVITVQFVRNITSEKDMLQSLLLILVIGSSVGSVCAVGAGFFLAGRALVPIKKAWQKQQQFVSDASHELRTPLAVIQTKTDLLWRSPTSTIQDKAIDISVISKEGRRLSKLVANLLTLARSDSDQLEIEKKQFLLSDLLGEIIEQYSEIALYQEKELVLDVPSSVFLIGDKERIHQLMVILLDNAMKFTKERGKILISCSQTSHSVLIKIQDNGIGIEEENIPKIFDRFFQVDKSRSEDPGAGLGLAIANWIIEKHHGKVKVQSKVAAGTCFEIVFPKNQKKEKT
ncbi:HAMP domain-containing histidine kinase [Bacillus sp. FJAT-49711]|uniref:sensor histidine kinase n=1 Tax=Bacillus sp. FJAT-49711 TaxID=2833585 RepID=UPI001BC92F01|nr:HAMP domain-containing sensor histidine kinase [Bacillus sp. FJAT-49711]MBS4220970.1 HAMP domain-containing histidine kinase [Bacillus sp. FJAT-49711]